jgi:hypothetical protein
MADANESIQQRIQIARRDAEALKDRIKRKKDELADTTCEYLSETSSYEMLHMSLDWHWHDMLTNSDQCVMSPNNVQNNCRGLICERSGLSKAT